MNKILQAIWIIIGTAVLTFSGCGGGGSGEGSTPGSGSTQLTTSVVKIKTVGTLPGGTLIGGIDITASLASGVSAKSTTSPPETDAGVVVASGVASSNSTVLATYTPASGATPAQARLMVLNTNGFGVGEFATVNGDIAAGSSPQPADFSATSITVTDLNGSPLSGLTVAFTVDNK